MWLDIEGKKLHVRIESQEANPGPKSIPGPMRAKREKLIEDTILKGLSANANASLAYMGKKVGLNQPAMHRRVEALKKRYNLAYLPEIDVEKLGYLKFLIFVKFLGRRPSVNEIKKVVESQPTVQLCLLLSGNYYDLIIYTLAEDNLSAQATVSELRTGPLIKYRSKWIATPFFETFNFVPLRDAFIDSLKDKGKEKLWKREWSVLKQLNDNGNTTYCQMDRQCGFDPGMSKYSYHTLVKKGVIKCMTISLQNTPMKYGAVVLLRVLASDYFAKNRHKLLPHIIQQTRTPTNRYLLAGDTGDYAVLIAPIASDGELEKIRDEISRINIGVSIRTAIIEQIITGKLCYRKIDKPNIIRPERLAEANIS